MPERSESSYEARVQIWHNDSDQTWTYAVDLGGVRDQATTWSHWGARRAAKRMAKRMAKDQARQPEDYTIEVRL